MSLIQVGDIYINKAKLSGVSNVQRTEVPGEGTNLSYSFTIFLEGSETSVVFSDADEAKRQNEKLVASIPGELRFSGGGCNLNVNYVNAIGAVTADMTRNEVDVFDFQVQMDGASVNLQYPDERQAQAGRNNLVKQVNSI